MFSGGPRSRSRESLRAAPPASGTVPSMWIEFSVRPPAAPSTPSSFAIVVDLARREAELRRGDEVVAGELRRRARRARLQAGAGPPPFSSSQLLPLALRELLEAAAADRWSRDVDRPRDRHVRADAGERLEHVGLRAVEAGRECVDGHDEADADGEAERGEDGAAAPPAELREHVGHVEHGPQRNSVR